LRRKNLAVSGACDRRALFLILHGWELDSERLLHDLAGYFGISC
jgi:hypothetical protein